MYISITSFSSNSDDNAVMVNFSQEELKDELGDSC